VIKKVPDLADHFVNKAKNLLTDRNHGVLLTTITLVSEMIQVKIELLAEFRNVCVLSGLICPSIGELNPPYHYS